MSSACSLYLNTDIGKNLWHEDADECALSLALKSAMKRRDQHFDLNSGALPLHKELQTFESRADAEIAKFALWRQPIRTILSSIYLSADGHYVGGRFNRKGPRDDEVGTAIITRMSYVLEHFATCSRATGADLENAMSVVDDRFAAELS